MRAVQELPTALREPVVLRELKDREYTAIAAYLRICVVNAHKRVPLERGQLHPELAPTLADCN